MAPEQRLPRPDLFAVLDDRIVDAGSNEVTKVECGVDEFTYRLRLFNLSSQGVDVTIGTDNDSVRSADTDRMNLSLVLPEQVRLLSRGDVTGFIEPGGSWDHSFEVEMTGRRTREITVLATVREDSGPTGRDLRLGGDQHEPTLIEGPCD